MRTVFNGETFVSRDLDNSDVSWWVELNLEMRHETIEPDLKDEKLQLHKKATCCGNFERVIFTRAIANKTIQHTAYCAWCAHKFEGPLKHKMDISKLDAITIPFGMHTGKKLSEIPKDYLLWCSKNFKEGNLKEKIVEYLKLTQV